MSKDFAGSATVQGTKVIANSINYKNSDISSSIQPEMVRRTSLHPSYNGEEIEDRIYYSLHNDAGACTFISPHMKLEITNRETSASIPNLEEPERELPIIDIIPTPPPIPGEPPSDDDEDTNWPTGGWGGGSGGWSTDHGDDSDTSNPSGPRTDFDDYASLLVASFDPPAGVESLSDVTRFYQNRSAMTTAKRAMMKTRSKYSTRGTKLNEAYAQLVHADSMYESSKIETATLRVPKLVNAPSMFKGCRYLVDIKLNDAKSLENAESMCESSGVGYFIANKTNFLSNAKNMFKNCGSLKYVHLGAVNSLTNMDGMFEGCNVPKVDFKFDIVESAKRAFAKTNYTSFTLNFPELRDGTEMLAGCPKVTEIKAGSELNAMTTASGMYRDCPLLVSDNNWTYNYLNTAPDMYNGCKSLTTVVSRFPSLQNADRFFKDCVALVNVDLDFSFPAITSAVSMCENCISIKEVDGTFEYLSNGERMFYGCKGLKTINVNFPSLTNANNMFTHTMLSGTNTFNAPQLEIFDSAFEGVNYNGSFIMNVDINPTSAVKAFASSGISEFNNTGSFDRLTNALYMFLDCPNLTSVDFGTAPVLTNIDGLFVNCSSLRDVSGTFPAVTTVSSSPFTGCIRLETINFNAPSLAYASGLIRNLPNVRTVTGNLSGLVNAPSSFRDNELLETFGSAGNTYPNLTNASAMFMNDKNLQTVNGRQGKAVLSDYPNLQNASGMFWGCEKLTSVELNAPNVTNFYGAFYLCSEIRTIEGDVVFGENLTNAYNILGDAKLDIGSFFKVYNALKGLALSPGDGNGCVSHIGVDSGFKEAILEQLGELTGGFGGQTRIHKSVEERDAWDAGTNTHWIAIKWN